jgi:hypothetical protein
MARVVGKRLDDNWKVTKLSNGFNELTNAVRVPKLVSESEVALWRTEGKQLSRRVDSKTRVLRKPKITTDCAFNLAA